MKTILGLDVGTSSIGWALVSETEIEKKIVGLGSRIIPIDGAEIIEFQKGNAQTKNADRRILKGIRKLNKRYKQRRNKLIYVLQQLNILPDQFQLTEPFLNPTQIQKVCIKPIAKSSLQPTALDLIELRVKALNERIEEKEFGKLLYWFNQLRGYAGGGEENEEQKEFEEDTDLNDEVSLKIKKYEKIIKLVKVLEIVKEEQKPDDKKKVKYQIKVELEGNNIAGETDLENLTVNESLELQIIIRRNPKTGKETSVTFSLPKKTNWRKKMEDLEKVLDELKEEKGRAVFISEYFLSILKDNKWAKIRNNVILRSRYQAEFDAIWEEQSKHHAFMKGLEKQKLTQIAEFLFPGNNPQKNQKSYRDEAIEKGLYHIIRNQIIYYQRELKDQTDLISTCRFEPQEKVVAKSHPTFQEYKILEQINKLSINTKTEIGKKKNGEARYGYEDKPIPALLKEWLFEELQNKKEIKFSTILIKLQKEYGLRDNIDFLNGMNSKASLKGNDTRQVLKKQLGELWKQLNLECEEILIKLWDILYNGKGNEYDLASDRTFKVLNFIREQNPAIPDIEKKAVQLAKIRFTRAYSAMSLKAINKVLPLVRVGRYFDNRLFDNALVEKITRLLNETADDAFEKSVQEYLEKNGNILEEGGLLNTYAIVLVYKKHTAKEYTKDELLTDYRSIKRLSQGDLRNPLAEQVVNEALMVIKDVWKEYNIKPTEIRIELARELKNNADERNKIYKANINNQKANERIKDRLKELEVEMSLSNIERYKIWSSQEGPDARIILSDPSKNDLDKMKLWEEQGLISPYTGKPIPLSKLFNKGLYDIDHIIPKSRYIDDSLANKIICETAVNKDKDNRTAMEYFENGSNVVALRSKENFIDEVNKTFFGRKRKNLLAIKIPQDPIKRQIKETQYISVRLKEELNKIVGNENVKTSTGGVTDYLRTHWGLTDKFKEITAGRFRDMQKLIPGINWVENKFDENRNKHFLKIEKWSKRFDHRHHAIDALVVACTEQKHIQRLNNLNKELQDWLTTKKDVIMPGFVGSEEERLEMFLSLSNEMRQKILEDIDGFRKIEEPWHGFAEYAKISIENIIVSHKPKDKLIIQKGKDEEPIVKIRGALHDSTLYGKSGNAECYRIPLSKFAGQKFATEKTIAKIVHPFLKKTILEHLEKTYKGDKKEAFSAEGIIELNKVLQKREKKNKQGIFEPAPHPPISSIKIFYQDPTKKKGEEDALQKLYREKSFNDSLYVKTGGNYCFAILEKDGKRIYDIISFYDAANLLKDEFKKSETKFDIKIDHLLKTYFQEKNKNAKALFILKQNDVVYMPEKDEEIVLDTASPFFKSFWGNYTDRAKNIYTVVKFSGNEIYFIKHDIAKVIENKKEFGSQNCYQKINEMSLKEKCFPIKLNRLGRIIEVNGINM